ncbi:O-methyltransferase [Amycolatopsis regifaucium]|uniref:Methyltransferase n=1 Tax=Amycolatopsis regifaucium TaxID=546365 RepID=A0A154MAS0_9PSEU|nr:O-methyltransferase [Amycolatopsis regifaucium]KZB81380.1 methyltransferase [Amycolatopsis regifaucium]OKA04645.1 methyltransferase [Amycolatopsis regifaucium]SFH32954.1 Predicted O-methyltransferase YrrM [Amycolatopsis regifaucium]
MSQQLWSEVDEYLSGVLVPSDPALEAALKASEEAGLPSIAVAPNQGKLLNLLARMIGARSILEIGTLGGYSTIWLARALPPQGELVTLEFDPKHAAVARENIGRAGLGGLVDVRVGKALDLLPSVEGPIDLAFIDADKVNNPAYFEAALKIVRPGGVIVVDNVVRGGAVADAASDDPNIQGIRRLHEMISTEPRVDATAFQTVGAKGYDGLTIALVKS